MGWYDRNCHLKYSEITLFLYMCGWVKPYHYCMCGDKHLLSSYFGVPSGYQAFDCHSHFGQGAEDRGEVR